MNGSDPKLSARELLEEAHPALVGLSHWIHANPELGFEESLAAGWIAEWLTTAGFAVTAGVAGMPTAVLGTTGPGPFHVVICAEYDALPGVGHACGHNVIAAASVGAGLALASVAEELGLRVTVMGTPAEESGGGKIRLIDAGLFHGVHAALMVHPWPTDVVSPRIIAVRTLEITYVGREAHAAGFPHLGINAADALVVAQTAIGLLRQHLLPTDRVHGIVTKGGDAPNIIPAHTTAQFMVRATDRQRLDEVTELVRRCFEAGALASGAEVAIAEEVAYADMVHDADLGALYRANAESLGRRFVDGESAPVSTDMGDVSHLVPSIHPMIGLDAAGAVNHQPAFAAAAVTPSADQAIFDAALAMSWTVIDAARDRSLRARLMGEAMVAEADELVAEAEELEAISDELVAEAIELAEVEPDQADELAVASAVLSDEAEIRADEAGLLVEAAFELQAEVGEDEPGTTLDAVSAAAGAEAGIDLEPLAETLPASLDQPDVHDEAALVVDAEADEDVWTFEAAPGTDAAAILASAALVDELVDAPASLTEPTEQGEQPVEALAAPWEDQGEPPVAVDDLVAGGPSLDAAVAVDAEVADDWTSREPAAAVADDWTSLEPAAPVADDWTSHEPAAPVADDWTSLEPVDAVAATEGAVEMTAETDVWTFDEPEAVIAATNDRPFDAAEAGGEGGTMEATADVWAFAPAEPAEMDLAVEPEPYVAEPEPYVAAAEPEPEPYVAAAAAAEPEDDVAEAVAAAPDSAPPAADPLAALRVRHHSRWEGAYLSAAAHSQWADAFAEALGTTEPSTPDTTEEPSSATAWYSSGDPATADEAPQATGMPVLEASAVEDQQPVLPGGDFEWVAAEPAADDDELAPAWSANSTDRGDDRAG